MNWFSLLLGDAVEQLRSLPSGSIDLVITDPAYESLEKHRAIGTTTRLKKSDASSNEWFEIFRNERFPELLDELYRVMAKNSHLYVYCDLDTAKVIDPMGVAAGFTMWNWICWDKVKNGMGYHYRRRKEFIVFFEKGKRRLHDLGIGDVLEGLEVSYGDMIAEERIERGVDSIKATRVLNGYPTEKPVAVSEVLISQSSNPGEIVLDCFFGSGSIGEAAFKHDRNFIGIDLSPKAHAVASPRLSGLGMKEIAGDVVIDRLPRPSPKLSTNLRLFP